MRSAWERDASGARGAASASAIGGGGREILTLQFGTASNFVGAHYWNLQDERMARRAAEEDSFSSHSSGEDQSTHVVDPSVLYREGLTNRGVPTYTPRVLYLTLKRRLDR